MADKPEFLLVAAKFNQSTWAGCKDAVSKIVAGAGGLASMPVFDVFVFRLEGAGYWAAQELAAYLRRADIQFVQTHFSTPLAGFLSATGRAALQEMGVEFWNKDE